MLIDLKDIFKVYHLGKLEVPALSGVTLCPSQRPSKLSNQELGRSRSW